MTDTPNIDDNSTVSSAQFEPMGEVLQAARTAKKLTLNDVSNHLRFSLHQINAIENNDFSALPQPMITRGFIRNYARLLEIDAEPLLASYRLRVPEKALNAVSVQTAMYQVMSGKESLPWLKYILGSIFILLFLLAWILYIDYMPKSAKNRDELVGTNATISKLPVPVTLPEIALPAIEPVSQASVDSSAAIEPTNVDVAKTSDSVVDHANPTTKNINTAAQGAISLDQLAAKNNAPEPVNLMVAPQANATKKALPDAQQLALALTDAQSTAPTKTNKVSMTVSASTWVQVTDKNGKVIFEKILSAGGVDGFDGEKPFNVVIGNAKATKLSFLGKAVDLTPYTTENNVARLKLE